MPVYTVIPLRFIRPASPLYSCSTTFCLRAWLMAKSIDGCPAATPKSLAPATVRTTVAVSRNAFAGMHPRCRHVPPNFVPLDNGDP